MPVNGSDLAGTADAANLRYVTDAMPGIRRVRAGRGFRYVDADGQTVRDAATRERIVALAIPPAWRDVWICPLPEGHIQATGRDELGRKQYIYHPQWRAVRDATKYDRMIAFAEALPAIRARVDADLSRRGLPREKVVATVVRLLETTYIRVGNRRYAQRNGSFGLTTLRDRHVKVSHSRIHFHFKGKSGKEHDIEIADRRPARIVRQCRDIPGYQLFQYIDDNGERQAVQSDDVNAYLRDTTGQDFTAKDFRTWAGTVLAAFALQEFEAFDSKAAARRNITRAIEKVAGRLGNTPAICRKCYVHPEVFNAYLDGDLIETLRAQVEEDLEAHLHGLSPEEAAVLAFLQKRLAREAERSDAA